MPRTARLRRETTETKRAAKGYYAWWWWAEELWHTLSMEAIGEADPLPPKSDPNTRKPD